MTRRCRHGLQTDWCWGNSGWGLETRDLDWEIGRHQRLCLSYRPCPIRPYGAPSPRGEGCDTKIPLSPSNLRPFGAPPSIGRREYPRKPLPLEGAAERSEAGLAFFFCGEAPSSLPSPFGKGDRAAALGCSRKRRTCDDLLRSLSYRFPHPTSAPSGHLLP